MNRRELLSRTGTAALGLGLSTFPLGWAAGAAPRRRVLFFTKSSGFEHPVIRRQGEALSHAERILTELGQKHGFDVTCTKDGGVFTPEGLAPYDVFLFYTTGDLTERGRDGQPPMPPAGKETLLKAIQDGKGFAGTHSATDTFHTAGDRYQNYGERADPYIRMIGGEFIKHGPQQPAKMRLADAGFPGLNLPGDFTLHEEWYSLKDFAPNLHVLLVQETEGMKGPEYRRPPFPATWARTHGKGRVFYTSMGHREDVWTNPVFQQVLLGGLSWAARNVDADVMPNLETVTPGHAELPPRG